MRWGSHFSDDSRMKSGVRQGGVLSPLLFTLFVDIVLLELEKSGLGCFVNFTCYNSFMYADDLILLSNSVSDLQSMLNLCNGVFKMLDLPINETKCHCMRIGPRCNVQCASLRLNNVVLEWVDKINYLGITVSKNKYLDFCWKEAKRHFYICINSFFDQLGTDAHIDVLLKLIYSQAVPKLLYGTCAIKLSLADRKSLKYAYNSFYSKIFKSFDSNVIANCQYFCNYMSFDCMHDLNRIMFLKRVVLAGRLKSKSSIDLMENEELKMLLNKYNLMLVDSDRKIKGVIMSYFKSSIHDLDTNDSFDS